MKGIRRRSHPVHGVYVMVTVAALIAGCMGVFVFGRSSGDLALQKAPSGRLSYVPSFDPIADVTLGLPMDAGNDNVRPQSTAIRAIKVYRTQIVMLAGGKNVRTIPYQSLGTLRALVDKVNDTSWLSASGTTVTVYAAVIAQKGVVLKIAAPQTKEVVLQVRQGVFLAADEGALSFDKVYVHASTKDTPSSGSRTAVRVDLGRPFILANQNATMTIANSTFRYLGRDWNSSYGIAWSKGSTGFIRDSLLEHNFIGIYTDRSKGLKIQRNRFYYNTLYGVDPHSYSSDLLVEHNIANYNGRHGIIFSDHVTNGVVRNNTTIGNGLNGIMMDEESTSNVVMDNIVTDNKSDGIVLASSGQNQVTGNTVRRNRVGVHVRGDSSTGLTVAGNTVSHNIVAAQGVSLAEGNNDTYANGGQWEWSRIGRIGLATLALWMVLLLVTWVSDTRGGRGPGRRSGVSTA